MATYTFKTVTNGQAKFKKGSEYWHIIEEGDTLDQIGANVMRMKGHNGTYDIDLTVDTVIIDVTTYAPGSSFDTVYDALNPLFHRSNSGSAGPAESTQVTDYQEVTATANQTVFEFSNIPASTNDFMIFQEGSFIRPFFYSHTTSAITLSTGAQAGNVISYQRLK